MVRFIRSISFIGGGGALFMWTWATHIKRQLSVLLGLLCYFGGNEESSLIG